MLSYSSDFWPLLATIIGGGAALTVILTALIAFLPHVKNRGTQPAPVHVAADHDDFDGYLSRAA
jgi:hypothetical protein